MVVESFFLSGERRDGAGKGVARKLRRRGLVPAVVYGGGDNLHVALSLPEFKKLLSRGVSETTILRFGLQGEEKERQVMIKEVQCDPLGKQLLHVDLYEIAMDRPVRLGIPIVLKGDAPGVKEEDGMLHQLLRELEIECLPSVIPSEIAVDVSSLRLGDSVHVRDLRLDEQIRVLTHPEEPIASVIPPEVEKVEEEKPAEVEEEAPTEAEEES